AAARNTRGRLRGVWLKNTSGGILDSGTFNIIDNGTFAGEGVLDRVHPDERRLLSYAADTAVHVKREDEYSDKPYSRVKVAKSDDFDPGKAPESEIRHSQC